MSGFLFHETIFGPVMSRRLGVSLGINLLPVDYKYCTFNCVYCECGWSHSKPGGNQGLPGRDEIRKMLEERLMELQQEDKPPDAITFAGNGEPTIHPQFAGIIDDTIELRDEYFPEAKVTVLSNASMLDRDHVFNALLKVDNNIQKLDAGTQEMFSRINQPGGKLTLDKVVEQLCMFDGRLIIQTLFLRGEHNGSRFDNTTDEEISQWLEKLKKIKPEYVMIYPVDRATPEQNIERVSFSELEKISSRVEAIGIKTKVFG